jgi:hypothetical protein
VPSSARYKIVKLASGVHSVHSLAERETFHPVIGPVAEAEALYVKQLRLPERLATHSGEFVIWDVGLGAAANVLTVLRATRHAPCPLRILSFDHTLEPLQFALEHSRELGYFDGYESTLQTLLKNQHVEFTDGNHTVTWQINLGDFPTLLAGQFSLSPTGGEGWGEGVGVPNSDAGGSEEAGAPASVPASHQVPARHERPHSILFDAYSPAKNPAMWTAPLFTNLFKHLDPARPCAMPTYSRSTMLRVTLLLAGFFVGAGHATGEKEETTIAANTPDLITEPLDKKWLQRARNSTSAEPMWEPVYRQAPLSEATWEKLQAHAQFSK